MAVRWLAALLLVAGCSGGSTESPASGPSSTAASSPRAAPSGGAHDARRRELLRAELQRDHDAVTQEHLHHRDAEVRRHAVRALARIRSVTSRPDLLEMLRDEDDEVVAWAAYGLGELCAGARDEVVRALATAVAVRASRDDAGSPRPDPRHAIPRAIGRCRTDEAEATLARWVPLDGPLGRAAIGALGDMGRARKRLREETLVALLARVEGDAERDPLPLAFQPLSRVEFITPSVTDRVLEVAAKVLPKAGTNGVFIVQALAKLDREAMPLLRDTLLSEEALPATRVHAARALTRFGRRGQLVLAEALRALGPKAASAAADTSTGAVFVPLEVLSGLTDLRRLQAVLEDLAKLEPPSGASAPVLRRFAWIRCRAAGLRAERDWRDPLLRACDPTVPEDQRDADPIPSSIAGRVVVGALGLDAVKLTGKRLAAWRTYAMGGDLRARQKALKQLVAHGEVPDAAAILAAALESDAPGLVATAAEVLADKPARGKGVDGEPVSPAIADAIGAQLKKSIDLEARAALLSAAAALRLKEVEPVALEACRGAQPSLHGPAHAYLQAVLGPSAPRCVERPPRPEPPAELGALAEAPTTLTLRTDIGPLVLHLDPRFAPAAVTRVIHVAKGGFYDGNVVHRTVPGFVAQFGSPRADGYGGLDGLPALPCETSPLPFDEKTVGVALAGRDTGATQLFVTLAATPHLEGAYAWLGRAEGPWDALIDGDRVLEVELE